eukprot:scaffold3482_cov122-Skeletonema_menzelii.AAC.2
MVSFLSSHTWKMISYKRKRRLPTNPHLEWLRYTTYILLVVGCCANVADEKIETLSSIGGSRHRLSIHRKKSERHRDVTPLEVVHSPVSRDVLVDGPSVRRHRHLARGQKRKDNKRHNRIKVRANKKDDEPDVKRGPIKDRKRSRDDKKMKKDD